MTNKTKCGSVAQIIPNRLYFASFDSPPASTNSIVYLNVDESVHYDAFYDDFGPLNLAVLFRFCEALHTIVESKEKRKIFVFTDSDPRNRVNGAYLLAAYTIIYHQLTADQAYVRIQAAEPPAFIGYRDAAMGPPSYLLHVQHVVKAIEKAQHLRWLDFTTFDPDEYEFYERVENGDLNWIVPDKILSFCGPHDRSYIENEYCYHAPEVYFDYFRKRNVSTIIRLNRKVYDSKRFIDAGFDHVDLFFIDGSTPSDEIVLKFIEVVEKARGAVAIHCKAGLGRTGTLIACWMMKHFKLTAPQCIAWLRICRPGSVIGPQQQFLIDKQQWCARLHQKIITPPTNENESSPPLRTANLSSSRRSGEKATPRPKILDVQTIKCKIANSNGKLVVNNNNNSPSTPKGAEANANVGLTNAKLIKPYSLRSKNETPTTNNRIVDETAINEFGQSQGDRLCEMKAKAQHHHPSVERSLDAQLIQSSACTSLTNVVVPTGRITPPITKDVSTIKPTTRFSSATTPIKQLRLSSQARRAEPTTSVFSVHRPSVSAGYHNMNVVAGRVAPISKITVSTNCRPSILKNNTSKKFLPARNSKPYSPASRVALDYARFNAGMSHHSKNTNTYVLSGLSKRNSTSNLHSIVQAESVTALRKYELRPRAAHQTSNTGGNSMTTPSRYDPAMILSPSAGALRSSLVNSKSAGRLM